MTSSSSRKIRVVAPYGTLVHEIRLSEAAGRWEARVITLPNQIWVEPGGRRALVFESVSALGAERMAAEFIRRDCIARGHRLADEILGADAGTSWEPSRRRVVGCPVRFMPRGDLAGDASRGAIKAVTHDISETGLFIITRRTLAPGTRVAIDLKLPGLPERLEGVVVWTRRESTAGSEPGMGIRLLDPPLSYRAGIQTI